MSKTPLTDAQVSGPCSPIEDEWVPDFEFVPADFARKLELRLAAAEKALEFYADARNWNEVDTGIGSFPGPAVDYGARAAETLKNGLKLAGGKDATAT